MPPLIMLMLICELLVTDATPFSIKVDDHQYSVPSKCSEVIGANVIGVRSLVLLFLDNNNKVAKLEQSTGDFPLEELIDKQVVIAKYVVRLTPQSVAKFNGIYNYVYDDFITFEESKVYMLSMVDISSNFTAALLSLRQIYFWRNCDRLIIFVTSKVDVFQLANNLKKFKIPNVVFLFDKCDMYMKLDTDFRLHTKQVTGDLFPFELVNLQGKHIRISLFRHVRDAHAYKSKTSSRQFYGRDAWMAQSFMKFINATADYFAPSDDIDYGENNGTFITGVFGDVAYNRTDVALNSRLMKPEFQNHVEYTYPHDMDDLVFLVPCSQDAAKFQYYKAFTEKVWIAVVYTCLVFLVIFLLAKTYKDPVSAALYTFGMFLGQNCPHLRTNPRSLGPFWIFLYHFYGFLIMLHYSALLYSIITVPENPQEIDTFEELAESNLEIYTLERYKRYIQRYGSGTMEPLKKKIQVAGEKELVNLITTHGHYAVLCKKSVADYSVINRNNFVNGDPVYRIMNDVPFPALVCYITQYGSNIKLTLNNYVRRIIESGIQDFWMRYNLYLIYLEENKFYLLDSTNVRRKIYLYEIYIVFVLFMAGCTISTVVFFLELFLHKKKD